LTISAKISIVRPLLSLALRSFTWQKHIEELEFVNSYFKVEELALSVNVQELKFCMNMK